MSSVFATDLRRRNEEKWAAVPSYIDFLLTQQDYDRPIAAVIDIDGTILDAFTYLPMRGSVEAIKQIKARGCSIFIVTARSKHMMHETIYELKDVGITPDLYKGIFFGDLARSHKDSKAAHRNTIRETHDLILAIGDRTIDLIDLHEDTSDDYCYLNLMMESMTQY